MRIGPDKLKPHNALREQMAAAGKSPPEVAPMVSLDLSELNAATDKLNEFARGLYPHDLRVALC